MLIIKLVHEVTRAPRICSATGRTQRAPIAGVAEYLPQGVLLTVMMGCLAISSSMNVAYIMCFGVMSSSSSRGVIRTPGPSLLCRLGTYTVITSQNVLCEKQSATNRSARPSSNYECPRSHQPLHAHHPCAARVGRVRLNIVAAVD